MFIKKEDLEKMYEKVNTDAGFRWERGIEHHPKSIELMTHLEALDFYFNDDHFCWKVGGDGDNGEALMYLLDMYFERKDMGL